MTNATIAIQDDELDIRELTDAELLAVSGAAANARKVNWAAGHGATSLHRNRSIRPWPATADSRCIRAKPDPASAGCFPPRTSP
ncbi:hypothetical protein [Burkholderia gladioli]|uniref:hypothetical protein n=1 Tax=Burkholderia gladioli TaxID=28095 RepID=UPI000F51D4BC|nr:hypothetical protein [Burkholderia gladioli]MDN7726538.1 hypothetical protein [Burkholderia gladioli]